MDRSAILLALPSQPSLEAQGGVPLTELVERAVRATGYPPLRGVEVSASGARVVLRGRVPSYYLKQVAQSAALAVPGVRELDNNLNVTAPGRA